MQRGVTLIDTIVGVSLMLVVFVGIVGAFQLGIDVVSNNKARSGAIALANERLEYVRSLAYNSIGTSGGIPAGLIPQSESVVLNGVSYTRRTVIQYADDPKDGTSPADTNGIPEDYKLVKVDLSWNAKAGARHITLVSRFSPTNGVETNPCGSPCGTIFISVVNAESQALSGASITIVNASISPPVSINTYTNANGTVSILGAPVATGYSISATKAGYSTARTYGVTAQNTDPNPANLTVAQNQTTSATFAVDQLGSKTINTYAWIGGQTATSVPSVAFTLQGTKTIGSGPDGPVYKYSAAFSSDTSGSVTVSDLEWDSYTIQVDGATGYDVASACDPQPESLAPGASMTTALFVVAHTAHSLLIDVRAAATGALLSGAYAELTRTGFSSATTTDPCGQVFFSGLGSAADYTVVVGASGYATSTTENVNVLGQSFLSVQLN